MWDQISNTQPKNFVKTTKTPKFSPKLENLGLKCMKCIMKDEEIESTYQVKEVWIRPKTWKEEGFWWKR